MIYKPDRVARSMKELLVPLEDEEHAREVNLEILTGICVGLHKPNGQAIAGQMLFMVAAMAAEMERDPTMNGLAAVDDDTLAIARARGESVTSIAAHLKIGRSALYPTLAETEAAAATSG